MIVWAIVATAAAIIISGIWIAYRRQVKKACRQLAFLKNHKTNLRLTSDLPFSELNELIDGINEIIDLSRKAKQDAQCNESQLKETITNLSHDIRTPLTSLDGYFQLLAQTESEEERRHYLAVIQSRIKSLKNMLEELFTYTKLQNANYELAMETIDFSKCIFDTVFSFYDEFKSKKIEPTLDLIEKKVFINGNVEAIHRSVQNIIKNALEHGKTQISLSQFYENDVVVFSCSNVVSNPKEIDIEQVFNRFYKADSARTYSSTGLGLAISKGLIEKMGGTVSAEIKGIVFTIKMKFPIQNIEQSKIVNAAGKEVTEGPK